MVMIANNIMNILRGNVKFIEGYNEIHLGLWQNYVSRNDKNIPISHIFIYTKIY